MGLNKYNYVYFDIRFLLKIHIDIPRLYFSKRVRGKKRSEHTHVQGSFC